MAGKAGHRGFGRVRRLPSGRFQASYVGPDTVRHTAPGTFRAEDDAVAWLVAERRLIDLDDWTPPSQRKAKRTTGPTLAEFFETFLAAPRSRGPLRPRTVALYRGLFAGYLADRFGAVQLKHITRAAVESWYADLQAPPVRRAHAYALLRAILMLAVERGHLTANPCMIRGAGQGSRHRQLDPARPDQVAAIAAQMPEKWRALVLVTAWCGLRQGEALELRRKDIVTVNGVTKLRIRRAVVRLRGRWHVGPPKSRAGIRDVTVPPHLESVLRDHLDTLPKAPETLLWGAVTDPNVHMHPWSLRAAFAKACDAAGVPRMRWHDLRHVGATLAAQAGATTAELMSRIGHSTASASLRYQHAASHRDAEIAAALSRMAQAQ